MNRQLIFFDEVTSATVKPIIEKIIDINTYDDDQESKVVGYERKPITLTINSPGGSLTDGFALIGAIETSKTPVHTIGMGMCASMAFLLLIAGKKRYAHNMSILMYHEALGWSFGSLTERQRRNDVAQKWMQMYDDYVIKRTKVKQKKLDEVKKSVDEWFIYADEALELGIVDEII